MGIRKVKTKTTMGLTPEPSLRLRKVGSRQLKALESARLPKARRDRDGRKNTKTKKDS